MRNHFFNALAAVAAVLTLAGCVSSTNDIPAVTDFNINRAQGVWFELAKSAPDAGTTPVFYTWKLTPGPNGLFQLEQYIGRRKVAIAETELAGESMLGLLKLRFSFFNRPTVRIIELNEYSGQYQTAIVCGETVDDLVILCRRPKIDQEELNAMLDRASELGFYTDIVRTRPGAFAGK